jgi:ketol-acid reductoisomerase
MPSSSPIYHEKDCDRALIQAKRVAIVGYGSQGHAHALNLRDSGVKDVRVALHPDSKTAEKAKAAGFKVMTPAAAAQWADVVVILTPDECQAELYAKELAENLQQGASLAFAHGLNVHFGLLTPRADLDVWMVAPKEIGPAVRALYVQGSGAPCLVAVAQDVSGGAKSLALSYAAALGGAKAGILETSFAAECEVDLFGEQAVLFGGLPPLMRAAFDTLVEAGYNPQMAYFKCVQQVKLVADAIVARGISGMNEMISNTAEYGGYVAGPRLVTEQTRAEMKRILADIQAGKFTKEFMADRTPQGAHNLEKWREASKALPIEQTGAALRGKMPGKK